MVIRLNDGTSLQVRRRLSPVTTEEDAVRIHQHMDTDKLVRGPDGFWYCCMVIRDVSFQDKEIVGLTEVSQVFDEQGLS